jgi:hypothetical protein
MTYYNVGIETPTHAATSRTLNGPIGEQRLCGIAR